MPTVQVEGLGRVSFPDGTPEADMTNSIQQALMEKNAPAPLSGSASGSTLPGADTPNPLKDPGVLNQASAYDTVKGMAKGALGTVQAIHNFNAPSDPRNSMYINQDKYPGSDIDTKAVGSDQMVGKGIETGLEMLAGGSGAADALPSAARAGKVFESIAKDAAQAPVNLKRAGDTLLELHELGATGSNLPKAVRQLTSRATAPGAADILYPEARKFASRISNSSIAERLTSDPNLKRVLGSLREGFNADVGEAAASVGRGHDYEQAMREFANAKKLHRTGAAVGTAAASGLGIGAKLGVLGHILGNITGGQ